MHIEYFFDFDSELSMLYHYLSPSFPLKYIIISAPESCYQKCYNSINLTTIYQVFVLQNGGYCGCGTQYGKYGIDQETLCNINCLGDIDKFCGGPNGYNAYRIQQYAKMSSDPYAATQEVESAYNYYYPRYQYSITGNSQQITIPTPRGFTLNSLSTYKLMYGPKLRNNDIIGEGQVCFNFTIDGHDHPLSWIQAEQESNIDNGRQNSFDYNALFA